MLSSILLIQMPAGVFATTLLGGFSLAFLHCIYQLWINKLATFPGPLVAKLTPFWLVTQCRRLQRSKAVAEAHRQHGDFVRIAPNHISINRPEALLEIYGHSGGYAKGPFYDAFMQVMPVIFTTRNFADHHRKRKYLNPAFSQRCLGDFEPYMDTNIRQWTFKMYQMCESAQIVDFCIWANYLAFDIISNFAFGDPFGLTTDGEDTKNLVHTIDTRGEVLNALGNLPAWMRSYMPYNVFDNFWSNGLRAKAGLEQIGIASFSRRKSCMAEGTTPRRDMLTFLFEATDPDTGKALTDSEIIAEAISFIVGGSDTTSSTITNFVDLLSRFPEVQQKLQAELDEAFPEVALDWCAPERIVRNLPYLNAILKEVMRYRPTSATGLERLVPSGGRMIAGRFIPGQTLVSVPTLNILHNGDIYPHPEEFKPDRWLTADTKMTKYFQPFSYGPRSCIGRNFATMEILKVTATLFRIFSVERTLKQPTIVREGFFNKVAECNARLQRRELLSLPC